MLQNKLFTFNNLQRTGDIVTTNIALNALHPIFKGHFPDHPVLPGACMMQMVKEVVEACVDKQTRLTKVNGLKFLSFIYPDQNRLIQMELKIGIDNELIGVDARLLDNAGVLFKFKGTFILK